MAQRAGDRRGEGRQARADRARRAARVVPGADAAAGLGGGRRLLERGHQLRRDRHGHLRRRRQGVGVRTPDGGRRRPGAAAPGRLRLPRGQQPARRRQRGDLQARLAGPRRRHAERRRHQRASPGGSARCPTPSPCTCSPATRTRTRTRRLDVNVADEAAVDLPSGGSWTSSLAPLAVVQAATNALGSTPSRVTGDMCARIERRRAQASRCASATATSRPPRTQADDGSLSNAVVSGAAGDLGERARARSTPTPASRRTSRGVSVLLQAAPHGRAGVHPPRLRAGAREGRARRSRSSCRSSASAAPRITRTYTVQHPARARPAGCGCCSSATTPTRATTAWPRSSSATTTRPTRAATPARRRCKALAKQVNGIRRYDGVLAPQRPRRQRARVPRRRPAHLGPRRGDRARRPQALLEAVDDAGRRRRRPRRRAGRRPAARARTPRRTRPSSPSASPPASPRPARRWRSR